MKTHFRSWLFLGTSVVTLSAAPFANLGFDDTKVPPESLFGNTEDVLPSWQVYHGDVLQPVVGFNSTHVFPDDITTFNVVSKNLDPVFTEGAYSLYVWMRGGDSFSLVQRGDVPENAPFLQLRKTNPWEVSVNRQLVGKVFDSSHVIPSDTPSRAVFDLSAYVGQNVELRLTASSPFPVPPSFQLDSLQFVREVPEPTIGGLLLLSLLLLVGFSLERACPAFWKEARTRCKRPGVAKANGGQC